MSLLKPTYFILKLESIDIVGRALATSLKYKNIVRHGRVAFVVDDIVSLSPYRARMIEIRGHAEIVQRSENDLFPHAPEMIRIGRL